MKHAQETANTIHDTTDMYKKDKNVDTNYATTLGEH